MTYRRYLAMLCLAGLVACGDAASPSYDTPSLTAVANGHTIIRQEYPGMPLGYLDTLLNAVFMSGSTDPTLGAYEHLGVHLWAFHGAGSYHLHLNQGDGGSAFYGVTTPTGVIYEAHGGPRDYAQVTHYNPSTGSIQGFFSFTGVDGSTGATVAVTKGRFIGRVVRH
jgi:hypothetical protein